MSLIRNSSDVKFHVVENVQFGFLHFKFIFFRIFGISLENAVFKSKFPVHGKSRKLSTIGGNDNIAIDAENNKKVTIQHCKDMKKCACR